MFSQGEDRQTVSMVMMLKPGLIGNPVIFLLNRGSIVTVAKGSPVRYPNYEMFMEYEDIDIDNYKALTPVGKEETWDRSETPMGPYQYEEF
ncbi:unnamed protein product [marine sediment metagenome]|uniref:Uncharacterized protein n=1 Tax=marine sediment metagenome TaxID=412755 RepID=X0RWH2_9ZZZZ